VIRALIRALRLWLVAALLLPTAAWAEVRAQLDRTSIDEGEIVKLTLERDGRGETPDLRPLEQDFEVLSRNSGTSIQFSGGSMSSQTRVQLTLQPRHGGELEIPPLPWGKEHTPALRLSVRPAGNASQDPGTAGDDAPALDGEHSIAAASPHVFITQSMDTTRPYLQSASILSVKLYTDLPLFSASLTEPKGDGLLVEQIGEDLRSQEERNGRHFQVVERRFVVIPQRSGRLALEGGVLDAEMPDTGRGTAQADDRFQRFFGNSGFSFMSPPTKALRLRGETLELDVQPVPDQAGAGDWLPARDLSIDEQWGGNGPSVRVGEPVTRHLVLRAAGVAASQLPDPAKLQELPPGFKAYSNPSQQSESIEGGHVVASRSQDVAIIATQPGEYVLPALHVLWWDTQQNAPRVADLPERKLRVLPASGAAPQASNPPTTDRGSAAADGPDDSRAQNDVEAAAAVPMSLARVLQIAALGLLVLILALGLRWLLRLWRRHDGSQTAPEPTPASASQARKDFLAACAQGEPRTARAALLHWSRLHWPDQPPVGLRDVARRLNRPELSTALEALDRACYSGTTIWDGSALASALAQLPRQQPARRRPTRLPGLYADH
jgi:hypothetical protein